MIPVQSMQENMLYDNIPITIKNTGQDRISYSQQQIMCLLPYYHTNTIVDTRATEQKHLNKSPSIEVDILGTKFDCLLDSGADVSCIDQSTTENYKEIFKQCSQLPVNNMQLKIANGQLTKTITSQMYVPIMLNKQEMYVNCLVVPNLIHPIILGIDWLGQQKMTLDFKDKCLKYEYENQQNQVQFKRCHENMSLTTIQDFNMQITESESSEGTIPNILKGITSTSLMDKEDFYRLAAYNYEIDKHLVKMIGKIAEYQEKDKVIKEMKEKIAAGNPGKYIQVDNIVYHKTDVNMVLVTPKELIRPLIWETHYKYAHVGAKKVYNILKTTFIWKRMGNTIRQVLSTCQKCQSCKYDNRIYTAPLKNIIMSKPGEMISIDFLGELPRSKGNFCYLLNIVDLFSKHVSMFPIRKATTEQTINKLKIYFEKFGKPEQILTDRGTQFMSFKMKDFLAENDITHRITSIKHPRSNPIEKYQKHMIQLLRVYIHKQHTKWIEYVSFIEQAINNSVNEVTGYTPEQLRTGKESKYFWDEYLKNTSLKESEEYHIILAKVKENVKKRCSQNKRIFDAKLRKHDVFKVDQMVWVHNFHLSSKIKKEIHKFFSLWTGPNKVSKVYDDTSYEIVNHKGDKLGVYHVSHLKSYKSCEDNTPLEVKND